MALLIFQPCRDIAFKVSIMQPCNARYKEKSICLGKLPLERILLGHAVTHEVQNNGESRKDENQQLLFGTWLFAGSNCFFCLFGCRRLQFSFSSKLLFSFPCFPFCLFFPLALEAGGFFSGLALFSLLLLAGSFFFCFSFKVLAFPLLFFGTEFSGALFRPVLFLIRNLF